MRGVFRVSSGLVALGLCSLAPSAFAQSNAELSYGISALGETTDETLADFANRAFG